MCSLSPSWALKRGSVAMLQLLFFKRGIFPSESSLIQLLGKIGSSRGFEERKEKRKITVELAFSSVCFRSFIVFHPHVEMTPGSVRERNKRLLLSFHPLFDEKKKPSASQTGETNRQERKLQGYI